MAYDQTGPVDSGIAHRNPTPFPGTRSTCVLHFDANFALFLKSKQDAVVTVPVPVASG